MYAPFTEGTTKGLAHPVIVGRQQFTGAIKQMKRQLIHRLAPGLVLLTQPLLDGEGELNTAGTGTDHTNGQRSVVGFSPFQQGQPTLVETGDGFDRDSVVSGTRNVVYPRRGTNVDGQQIPGDVRAVLADNPLVPAVNANGFIPVKAGAGEFGELAQINMNIVVFIMPGNIAGQHTGVGRMGIAADQGQTNPRYRLHRKTLEYTYVAVATPNQNDIAQYRLFVCSHSISFFASADQFSEPRMEENCLSFSCSASVGLAT